MALQFEANQVGSFLNGTSDFIDDYRNIQTYFDQGIDPSGAAGWYPSSKNTRAYSSVPPVPSVGTGGFTSQGFTFTNYKEAKSDSQRLPYVRSFGGSFTWEETWAGVSNGKIPVGSSVLFTSDTSRIAGKTSYRWRITEGKDLLVETLDPMLMWNFTYPGVFGVELSISDTNGNTTTRKKETFIEVTDYEN